MIAVDTNILVYAHRKDSPFHDRCRDVIVQLIAANEDWSIPWSCLHEFYAVATHARIYTPPSTIEQATKQMSAWLGSPKLYVIHEIDGYWEVLQNLLHKNKITGPKIHDARIAAICLQHNIKTLWSADRDFSRIPQLKVANPLL